MAGGADRSKGRARAPRAPTRIARGRLSNESKEVAQSKVRDKLPIEIRRERTRV